MDAAKEKRLIEYAAYLEKQGQSEESQGRGNEAAKIYVKLVDVLLLLAREAKDHPTWQKYATKAEAYQKRAKQVIADSDGTNEQSSKTGAIKKMFGLKSNEEKPAPYEVKTEKVQEVLQVERSSPPPAAPKPADSTQHPEGMVPLFAYKELLEKNKELQAKLATMVEKSDYDSIEKKNRELAHKLDATVPKEEYDELRGRLENSVPRTDYEDLKLRLLNSVPRGQYEELQKACVNMVPRETYLASQARVSELESQLKSSMPLSAMDSLASEISLLAVTAAIPMEPLTESGADTRQEYAPFRQTGEFHEELASIREKIEMLESKIRAAPRRD